MARAERNGADASRIRGVGHRCLREFAQKQTTHSQLFLRQIGYLNPRVSTSYLPALVITSCYSYLIKSGRQFRGIRERDVFPISLRRLDGCLGRHNPFEETRLENTFVVVVDAAEIDYRLYLAVRLFTKRQKFAGHLNGCRNRWSFVRNIVVVGTDQYWQFSFWIWCGDRLAKL